jgi:hypothetical protein
MNPFIEASIKVIEQAMTDVDIRLDRVEELADEAAQTFNAKALAESIEVAATIRMTLAKSLKEFDHQFDALAQELRIDADEAEVYRWDYVRPIIYRIRRAEEEIDTIRKFLLS